MQETVLLPYESPLCRTKVSHQLGEWSAIRQHREGTTVQKAIVHVVFPVLIVSVPLVAIVPAFGVAVGYECLLKDKLNPTKPDRPNYLCAEELLRHYYHGHKSLGGGVVDGVVAKGSRMMHGRSRHHAGTIQRAFEEYKNKLEAWRAEIGENPSFEEVNRKCPELLLLSLKEKLIARGRTLNIDGDLAAAIYVIQDRCHVNVINLLTINTDIAAAKAQRQASAARSSSSLWGGLKKLNPFGSSSRPEEESDDENDRTLDH